MEAKRQTQEKEKTDNKTMAAKLYQKVQHCGLYASHNVWSKYC